MAWSIYRRVDRQIDISSVVVRVLFLGLSIGFLAFVFYGLLLLAAPFGIALILTIALSPLINVMERWGFPRWLAVLSILLSLGMLAWGVFALTSKPITNEYYRLTDELELYEARAMRVFGRFLFILNDTLRPYLSLTGTDLSTVLQNAVMPFKQSAKGLLDQIPTVITYLLITPIITFIFLLQGDQIYKNLLAMVPNRYFEMTLLLVKKVREQITSYLRGLFWQWLILMAILVPGLMLVGLPYAPLVAFVAASVNIVPYMGPLLGVVPAVVLAAISPGAAALVPLVLLIFLVAQVVDNAFTQPIVLAKSVQIHPLISILAIITAFSTQSVALVMIAIPLTGIVMVSIQVMYRSLKAFRMI